MANQFPDPRSERTMTRACALAWYRGCVQENSCWDDCYAAAKDTIVLGELDAEEREAATTGKYWEYTNWARKQKQAK